MPTRKECRTIRESFRGREPLIGGWTSLAHPSISEMFCSIMRPDFLGIDIEHGTISQEQSQRIIAAAQANGTACLPRIASHNPEMIKRLLDSGASGIIVPMVDTPEELEKIVAACKYPPVGKRSYGVARAQGYGAGFDDYVRSWNEKGTLIIQIESIASVDNIDALVSQEPVDGVMMGPYDISGSLGIPGELDHPKVRRACERVVEACQKHGKSCGTQIVEPTEENVKTAFQNGFTFAVLASDIFLMWKWSEKMRGLIRRVRE